MSPRSGDNVAAKRQHRRLRRLCRRGLCRKNCIDPRGQYSLAAQSVLGCGGKCYAALQTVQQSCTWSAESGITLFPPLRVAGTSVPGPTFIMSAQETDVSCHPMWRKSCRHIAVCSCRGDASGKNLAAMCGRPPHPDQTHVLD